uniref:transposase n=1 Tax=Pseudomonas citri TaxID=2978349 RepID=UPI0036F2DD26
MGDQKQPRRWSPEQKLAMVGESLEPGQSVWMAARRSVTASMPTSCSCSASCIRTAACRRSMPVKRRCLRLN